MEISKDEKQVTHNASTKKGGLKTMPYIIANEACEKLAGIGLQANMIVYLKNEYHLSNATGATILFIWSAFSNFTPIVGAFVSDSYLGRFRVIALGTVIALFGLIVLWLTALIPSARPPYCKMTDNDDDFIPSDCASPKPAQLVLLFASFVLMAIGAGGIRPCSLAFGADQFDNPNNPKNETTLQSFFNWYYAAVGISIMISVLVVVGIQDAAGWVVGYALPIGFMFLSTVLFLVGSSRYIKVKPNKSLFTGFAKVISASWRHRHLDLPPEDSVEWYYQKGSKLVKPTDKLRFLNKACLIRDQEKDLDSEGLAKDSWKLCTVKQVEELKALIKVLPIWSTGIVIAVTMSQQAFPVVQAETMDRRVSGNIKLPAGSFGVFTILALTIWVAIYDRLLVPMLAKITKRPRGLTNKQRMGIGIVLSCIATGIAGLVEQKRRSVALRGGFAEQPKAVVDMSAMLLVPQYCLLGLTEAFNAVGQLEFYYSQFPKTMSSIGIALLSLGMAVGNLLGSLIVTIVNHSTKGSGKVSWVSDNLNRGHYDYYYWLLSLLCAINFIYYLVCSWGYGPEDKKIWDDPEEDAIESPILHAAV